MNPYKRPEKETDPAKFPGQIINRPVDFEKPLQRAIEEYKQLPPKHSLWDDEIDPNVFDELP